MSALLVNRRLAVGVTAAATLALSACGADETRQVTDGDPDRGRTAVLDYGCVSCHTIPDLPEADARVGPDLGDFATRRMIAGQVPNQPEVLIQWLREPQSIEPGTAMPDMGISEQDARDIAAYLYSQ